MVAGGWFRVSARVAVLVAKRFIPGIAVDSNSAVGMREERESRGEEHEEGGKEARLYTASLAWGGGGEEADQRSGDGTRNPCSPFSERGGGCSRRAPLVAPFHNRANFDWTWTRTSGEVDRIPTRGAPPVRDEWPCLGEGLAFDPRRFSLPSGRTAHRHPTPDMAPLYTCPGCIRQFASVQW